MSDSSSRQFFGLCSSNDAVEPRGMEMSSTPRKASRAKPAFYDETPTPERLSSAVWHMVKRRLGAMLWMQPLPTAKRPRCHGTFEMSLCAARRRL